MGCFDERCAITNVAVHHGDEVFFMYVDELWGETPNYYPSITYDIHSRLYPIIHRYKNNKLYPWEEGMTLEQLCADEGIHIAWGTYNDYGWIEEIERNMSKKYLRAFVHTSVVEAICAEKGIDLDDKVSVLYELLVFSHFCRLSFHTELGGEQYGGQDELKYQRKRVELITQVLDTKEKDPESLFNPFDYEDEFDNYG